MCPLFVSLISQYDITWFKIAIPLNKCLFLNVIGDNPYKLDPRQINQRASLLQKYLCDEQKELQALYALQTLMVHMEQPASECPAGGEVLVFMQYIRLNMSWTICSALMATGNYSNLV